MSNLNRLGDVQIDRALEGLQGWVREGNEICKEYRFGDFAQAFRFLTGVAFLAHGADHHPEIWNVYNRVRLRLSTHDAGGLTARDIELAQAIEDFL